VAGPRITLGVPWVIPCQLFWMLLGFPWVALGYRLELNGVV
tara:strand:- start:659 stop:781 length:123 start_codon:yes stop_codon:yes gene_type:complete